MIGYVVVGSVTIIGAGWTLFQIARYWGSAK